MMKLGVLAALDQRIAVRYALRRMTAAETTSYINHHLALAGRSDTLFSDDAIALIHQTSRGLPTSGQQPRRPSPRSPRSPRTRPSSTSPPPAPPSPNSPRQSEHHRDN